MPVTQPVAGNMCGKLYLLRWFVDIVCLLMWQTVYSIYFIRYFNVLVSVIMEYTISYREIRYLVNRSWHTVCSALLPKPLTAANATLWTFIHHSYVFIRYITIMTQKKRLCVTQFQFFYVPVSIHYSFPIRYRDATTRSACQTLACTQVTPSVHYELALTNVTHNTFDVSLLQASVKLCCDLPKQSTFPLLLLCLIYSNWAHITTFHTHKILLRCSNAQLPQFTTWTERKHSGNNITASQATAQIIPSDHRSTYVAWIRVVRR